MLILDTPANMPLDAARARLHSPRRSRAVLPAFGAAGLAAATAVALAGAVILGPPWPGPAAPAATAAP